MYSNLRPYYTHYKSLTQLGLPIIIGQMGIIEHAQENAAKQLIPMLTMLGYAEKDITISFRKRFTMEEITRFIENSTTQTNGKDN